jgi:N-acetylneuraminic acid mutarotase
MMSQPSFTLRGAIRSACFVAAMAVLAACHGSSSANASSFTIGGTISGLSVGSVVLVYNASTTVTVSAGETTWVFPGSFASGSSYSVAVESQPAGELCSVAGGGSGATLTADVDDVTVICSTYGQWTWQGGSSSVDAIGIYGAQGATSASNVPGARYAASSWTDSAGDLWLFGGMGYDAAGGAGELNDLWQYSRSTGQWSWVGGSSTKNALGAYGSLGTAAASNVPGARYSAVSWIDSTGNLWLFGGYGYDMAGGVGELNDLWTYSPITRQWTWISGGNGINAIGVYGTLGAALAGNVPGARYSAVSWIDSSGNLWLFGGFGYDSTGTAGKLNDLWKYSPSSSQWTWVGGGNEDNAIGVYGTRAVGSAANVPGSRQAAISWTDKSGDLWLFGGYGYDSAGGVGYLNDLWKYSSSAGQWTWISGSSADNASGVFGTSGTASAGNVPGSRQGASSWIDSAGNLLLFGGTGYGSSSGPGYLNDLWEFNPGTGFWIAISGGTGDNAAGTYGTQGTISAGAPGARQAAASWIDSTGSLWLFGGAGYGSASNGDLNDLWQFIPP